MAKIDWNPGKLAEVSGAYWKGCTLQAGVKLDVFSRIGDDRLDVEALAESMKADLRGTAMLLHALAAMELLQKNGDGFANTPFGLAYLDKRSPAYMGYILQHHYHLVESWARLDRSVLTGTPQRDRAFPVSEEWRESFLLGMFNIAMGLAPGIVEAVDLSGRRHLLDLGGGPGTYGIHFCRKNPDLRATVFDLPATRPFAEQTIAKFNLSHRVDFQEGDYTTQEIPGSYDCVWISHIFHAEGPDMCRDILRKAVSVLVTGGMIFIHDFILDDTMDGPLFPALFALNMLVGTPSGRAYSEAQIREMLEEAGVADVQRLPYKGAMDNAIIAGRR